MLKCAFALAVAVLFAQDAVKPADDSPECRITLQNGSVVRGTLRKFDSIQLKTGYGTLKIPLKDLTGISFGNAKKEERDVVAAKGETYRGWVDGLAPLEVSAGECKISIPAASLRTVRIWEKGLGTGDDFELPTLEMWTSQGQCKWTTENGRLRATPLVANHNLFMYEEVLGDAYRLDVDVEAISHAAILWNMNTLGTCMTVWLNQNDITVWEGATMLTRYQVALPAGEFYHVSLAADGVRTTITVNGSELGTVESKLKGGKPGLNVFQGTARFDNFRITRG